MLLNQESNLMKNRVNSAGLTLVELLIAIFAMALVVAGAMRLFKSTNDSYTLQNANTEMHQNGKFTFQHLRNLLEEAGAGLPLDVTVLELPQPNEIRLLVNSLGGITELTADNLDTKPQVLVDSTPSYAGGAGDAIRYLTPPVGIPATRSIYSVTLDSAKNSILYLSQQPAPGLKNGGFITAPIDSQRYFLNGTDLCLNSTTNVLAENISSLAVDVLDSSGTSVTNKWSDRLLFSIQVTATNGKTGKMAENITWSDTVKFQN